MANAGDEEVKTLFLSGLPDDIKEREIYNLFRIHKGYESCQLKYSGRGYQIVAFAVFTDQQSALAAKEALNGLKFDPQTGATLHIELARANSRTKRSRSEDSGLGALEKKYRGPVGTPGAYPDPGIKFFCSRCLCVGRSCYIEENCQTYIKRLTDEYHEAEPQRIFSRDPVGQDVKLVTKSKCVST